MALTISEDEKELMRPVAAPAYACIALANDFFSWQKEYDDFTYQSKSHYMVNAIWILMQEHSITIEKAKQTLREKVAEYLQAFLRLKARFQSSKVVSSDAGRYLSAIELFLSGNVGWSQFCPRYGFSENIATSNAEEVEDKSPIKEVGGQSFAIDYHEKGGNKNQSEFFSFSTYKLH